MGPIIKVLNHGFAELIDSMGSDSTVVNTARVSFGKSVGDTLSRRDCDLLEYLAKHGHWSPFAHPVISVRVKAPISVQRQWFKHKVGVAENSESTRYVKIEPEFYIPERLRLQSKDKKQGSDGFMKDTVFEQELRRDLEECYIDSYWVYKKLLEAGVANESARDVLPLATYTTWISTMSLYAAFNLWKQRTHDGAQWEITQYASALASLVEGLFPHSWKALSENI